MLFYTVIPRNLYVSSQLTVYKKLMGKVLVTQIIAKLQSRKKAVFMSNLILDHDIETRLLN